MNERQRTMDKRLEAELRSLPEIDPPHHLVSRVLEHVAAIDVEPVADVAANAASGPRNKAKRSVPLWQPAVAALAFAAIIAFVAVRDATSWIGMLHNGANVAAGIVHFVSDLSIAIIAGSWTWIAKTAVLASTFQTVVRTVAEATVSEFGPFIAVAVAAAVVLQVALLAVVARRPEVS